MIPILMYHSIESMPKSSVMRSLHVTPKSFYLQMSILNIFGFQGLSIKDLEPYLNGEKKGKVVGITFDDGYQNILVNAAPVLKKYNFTATCYIVSDLIGKFNSWDLENGIKQISLLSENDINEWIKLGMHIGAHSKSHADLTSISELKAQCEISDCKISLEENFKIKVTDFCYPYGKFNESVSKMVMDSGFQTATSMLRGRVNSKSDFYQLPRIPVNFRTHPLLFLAKILTSYEDKK